MRTCSLAPLLVALAITAPSCATTGQHQRRALRPLPPEVLTPVACGQNQAMTVTFYDVGQGLAALVQLPSDQTILVDVGESPSRHGCGEACSQAHDHLVQRLRETLGKKAISMVWVTHQHSDHLGGAMGVLRRLRARHVVDNGTDGSTKQVELLREAGQKAGAELGVVGPGHGEVPLRVEPPLKLTAIVPNSWPSDCSKNKNDCSIGLRIDYCASSVLFTGDAEAAEEALLPLEPVTLIQVGHHGSNTSSGEDYVTKTKPVYAVISSGKPGEGTNAGYCHPRSVVVERISAALGPSSGSTLLSFDGAMKCKDGSSSNWRAVPVNERLFSTARDGDVTLVTTGDGVFTRVP